LLVSFQAANPNLANIWQEFAAISGLVDNRRKQYFHFAEKQKQHEVVDMTTTCALVGAVGSLFTT
jgi:hypothetical protein